MILITFVVTSAMMATLLLLSGSASRGDLEWRPAGLGGVQEGSLEWRWTNFAGDVLGGGAAEAQDRDSVAGSLVQGVDNIPAPRFSRIIILPGKNARFAGSGPVGGEVTVELNGKTLDRVEVDANGRWNLSVPDLGPGDHRVGLSALGAGRDEGTRREGQFVRIAIPEGMGDSEIVAFEESETQPQPSRAARDSSAVPNIRDKAESLAREASREFDAFTKRDDDAQRAKNEAKRKRLAQSAREREVGDADEDSNKRNSVLNDPLGGVTDWLSQSSRDYYDYVVPELAKKGPRQASVEAKNVPPPERRHEVSKDGAQEPAMPDFKTLAGRAQKWLKDANDTYHNVVVKELKLGSAQQVASEQATDDEAAALSDNVRSRRETPALTKQPADMDGARIVREGAGRQEEQREAQRQAEARNAAETKARADEERRLAEARSAQVERERSERLAAERKQAEEERKAAEALRVEEALAREEDSRRRAAAEREAERQRAEAENAQAEKARLARAEAERVSREAAENERVRAEVLRRQQAARQRSIDRREEAERARLEARIDAMNERAKRLSQLTDEIRNEQRSVETALAEGGKAGGGPDLSEGRLRQRGAGETRDPTEQRARSEGRGNDGRPAAISGTPPVRGDETNPGERPITGTDDDSIVTAEETGRDVGENTNRLGGPTYMRKGSLKDWVKISGGDESGVRLAGWEMRLGRIGGTGCKDKRAGLTIRPPGTYVVARGDTLWQITWRHYDRGELYPRIYNANRRKIRRSRLIYPCQQLWLPRL